MARALDENALNIYTDGSSFQTPRRGGVGVRFVLVDDQGEEQTIDWSPPGFRSATNNQMELKACTLALQEAKKRDLARGLSRIVIHTDSTYVRDNYRKAMFEWPMRRWHRRTGAAHKSANPVQPVTTWCQYSHTRVPVLRKMTIAPNRSAYRDHAAANQPK